MHDSANIVAEKKHAVVIAGAGPTGLMLAAELALARVDVAIVERRETAEQPGVRARGISARTLEELDQRGLAARFLAHGQPVQVTSFGTGPLTLADFPTRHPYGLALWQPRLERLLADRVAELAVPIYRGREVTGFAQAEHSVTVTLSDGSALHAEYLVGCDGGRSSIRKQAGIEFPGWPASTSYLIAEVDMSEEPAWGIRRDEKGVYALGKLEELGPHATATARPRVGIVLREDEIGSGEPTLDELRAALSARYGTDFGVHNVTWLSRFTDATRQAASYRAGRVLLAGDAAHVHSPNGGQGLNLGLQEALNLGWKLGQVVHGTAPSSLLDTYHAERHPVAARVLRATMALTALARGDARTDALREHVADMLKTDELRKRYAGMLSGLDVRYELGDGHPLLGRRMPDLDITTKHGATRVFTLLHSARALLLDFGEPSALELGAWADRVQHVHARYEGAWELPVVGAVTAPSAVLIRPDGYVAWISADGAESGLRAALTRWFGPANQGAA